MFLVGFELSHSIQKDRKPVVDLYFSSVKTTLVLFSDIGIPLVTQTHYMRFRVKTTSYHSTQEGGKPIVKFKYKQPEWTKGVSSANYKIDDLMQANTGNWENAILKPVHSTVNWERTGWLCEEKLTSLLSSRTMSLPFKCPWAPRQVAC